MAVKPRMYDEEKQKREDARDAQPGNEVVNAKAAERINPIVAEFEARLNLAESSFKDSAFWPDSMKKPYNPDDLVQRRYDYSIYEEMCNDDQVSVCLQIKKDLVLGSGFEIITDDEYADEDEGEEEESELPEKKDFSLDDGKDINSEMREFLEVALCEDPEYDFETSLEEILSAYEFGFSLGEIVFKQRPGAEQFTLKSLKVRHPTTWLIHADPQGNVVRYEQRGPRTSVDISPDAAVHYVNQCRFQNSYGRSDLRPAYNAWFIKREIIKFYAIFLEGGASPKPIARYDKNAPQEAVDAVYNAIKNLQTKSAMAIPKEIEMDYLESSNIGDAYTKGINIFNMFIGRALLIPDLLGFQGGETSGGSYALGKDQMMVLFKHIAKRRRELEKLINKKIIRPLIVNNFGPQEKYPKFRFKEIDDEKGTELAKMWLDAVRGKLFKASDEEINHFRELCRFPVGVVDREEPAPAFPNFGGDPIEAAVKKEEIEKVVAEEKDTKPVDKKEFVKAYDETPGDYHKKVNFKLAKTKLDHFRESIMESVRPLLTEIYDDVIKQIRDKKILQKQDLEKVASIKVKQIGKLEKLVRDKFYALYKEAQEQAESEIAGGIKGYAKQKALPDEDFLDFLDEETFQYLGDFEYNIRKQVRQNLVKAIKDGEPLNDVLGVLSSQGLKLSETSLERFARTKLTEVMNRGRNQLFESTGVVAAYQYSAILDDRTSEICEGLHGKVFELGNEPIPPMHFNCRSLLIPITKYEDYKADKSVEVGEKNVGIDKFIDDNIGDGFSRQ